MEPQEQCKPTKYYIDFENVHGAGLKGVDELDERDEVIVIYSQAAETFHIEHAIDILKSKARIEFVEVDGGTRNAADFQLIVALFGAMSDEYGYAIVSGDGGFDAAIKMGERMGLPPVRRIANVRGDEAETDKPKSRRSRRRREDREAEKETEQEATPTREVSATESAEIAPVPPTPPESAEQPAETQETGQDAETKETASRRRPRRRRRNVATAEDQALDQNNGSRGETMPETDSRGETDGSPSADGQAADSGTQPPEEPETDPTSSNQEPPAKAQSRRRTKTKAESAGKPQNQGEAGKADSQAGTPTAQGHFNRVKELLASKGIDVPDEQIGTIAKSIEGAQGKQDFYRSIIKIERQQRGRELYRLVREHFDALAAVIG